ncbi:unnamed protein product [Eruca vesicaria subsp. sativa]|uniref:Uncharacterized protein n=1 Tax=Eruca vesicaria subsp. sativa TaxID=29727 RepID=A0ABC8IWR3_ERUVS|nr:unnamed protein product [Eruca vesicaria subsp. sativa]
MEHYNTLGENVYNEKVKHWRFRVKIIGIYPYSYVTCKGPHHVYVLADEHGTKMEMTIYDIYGDRFRGLENESQIKCVATGKHAYAFREGFENRGGRRQTEGNLSDFRYNPRLPEVDDFRKSVNNRDPYVRKYEAIGPL